MNTAYTFSKVAHVVDIKLAFLDRFLYNLIVLIIQCKISYRKLYCFRKPMSYKILSEVWKVQFYFLHDE